MMCQRIGRWPISTIGLGRTLVSSLSRCRCRRPATPPSCPALLPRPAAHRERRLPVAARAARVLLRALGSRQVAWARVRPPHDGGAQPERIDLAAFQQLMASTYGANDAARGVPATVAWLAEEVGELAQAVRKGTARAAARVRRRLAWLASLANQVGIDLADAAGRYAEGCPRCGAIPCTCRHDRRLATPTAGRPSTAEQLGDLHGVERGALAEVVVADEQGQAAAAVDALVAGGSDRRSRGRCRRPAAASGCRSARRRAPRPAARSPARRTAARANSALIDSEWPVNTGTRTHVPDTARSGMSRILRLSLRSFCSSSVSNEPSSTSLPASGRTLKAIGRANFSGSGNTTAAPSWVSSAAPVDDLADLLVELVDAGRARRPRRPGRCWRRGARARPRRAAA